MDENRGLFSVKMLILKGIAGSVWALGENRLTHTGRYFVASGLKAKFLDRFVHKVLFIYINRLKRREEGSHELGKYVTVFALPCKVRMKKAV